MFYLNFFLSGIVYVFLKNHVYPHVVAIMFEGSIRYKIIYQ